MEQKASNGATSGCEPGNPGLDRDRKAPGAGGQAALGLIWFYRRTLSPALYLVGVRCRHQPTCSQYGAEAFRKHKFGRAFWLTFSRVTRCHPFGSHGFDPVPDDAPRVGWKFWKLGDWRWTERTGTKRGAEK